MPADLSTPFAPSCCEAGGEPGKESAQNCGCDPGLGWLCASHKFKAKIMGLIAMWRMAHATAIDTGPCVSDYSTCADELEELLDES